MGHTMGSTADIYGDTMSVPMKPMFKEISRIKYEGVNLKHLYV